MRFALAWAVILVVMAFPGKSAADAPEPMALLIGVEQARSSVRSGKLEILSRKEHFLPSASADDLKLNVVFEGFKRTFTQRSRVLSIQDSGGKTAALREKQLEAMENDREAFVRAGLGKWRDVNVRSTWDGENLFQYEESMGASYRNHHGGIADYVFDPRIMGIGPFYRLTDTVATSLGHTNSEVRVSLIGNERVMPNDTWHVLVKSKTGVERHFWIEDKEGFRVHRLEFKDKVHRIVADSTFDEMVAGKILPSKVIVKWYSADGKHLRKITMRVAKAELNVAVDPQVGTIGSVDLPIGSTVLDERVGKRIGYWSGRDLSAEMPNPGEQPRSKLLRPWLISIALVLAIAAAALYYRRRRTQP